MDSESQFRGISAGELNLIEHLLASRFPGASDLVAQLAGCRVRTLDKAGSLAFDVSSQSRLASVKSRVPCEGEAIDSDGVVIHFLLHVVGGVLNELEIYKEDGSRIKTGPPIQEIEVFAPG